MDHMKFKVDQTMYSGFITMVEIRQTTKITPINKNSVPVQILIQLNEISSRS